MANSRIFVLSAAAIALLVLVIYDRQGDTGYVGPAVRSSTLPLLAATSHRRNDPLAGVAFGDNPLKRTDVESPRNMLDRPPFSRSRRPSQPVAVVVQTPSVEPSLKGDHYILLGIASGQGGAVALLREVETGRLVKARNGARVGSWQARRVTESTVTLVKDDHTIELSVFGRRLN